MSDYVTREPTQEEVETLRKRFEEYLERRGEVEPHFYSEDVESFRSSDKYVVRFLKHVIDDNLNGSLADNTLKMVVKTFQWRKEVGIRDIKLDDLDSDLKKKGVLCLHNRDLQGKELLIYTIRLHQKENIEHMKKAFLYLIESVERTAIEDDGMFSLMFDSSGAGLRNVNMEFFKYVIDTLKEYSPYSINQIIIYDMPWVLSAAYKIIKGLMPAAAVRKNRFVTKDTFKEYVADDQRLVAWGGTDDWTPVFEST